MYYTNYFYSESIDLQLPTTEEYKSEEYSEDFVTEESKEGIIEEHTQREFKEKVVESLGGGQTSFKKRKFGQSSKRNTRQRLDDD